MNTGKALLRIAWIPVLLALACNAPSRSDYATPSPTVTQTLPAPQATERAVQRTQDARSTGQASTVSAQDAEATAVAAAIMGAPTPTLQATTSSGTVRPTFPPPVPATQASGPSPTFNPGGTPIGTQGVLIQSFTADAATIDPGDAVTVRWQTTAQTITLCMVTRTGLLGTCEPVPANGSHEYSTSAIDRNFVNYLLFAQNGDQQESAGVTVMLTCPVTWFFANPPNECPLSEVVQGPGAAERFEHGLMIWTQADDTITILYDDPNSPKWDRSNDPWAEGMPQDDPGIVPPAGLYQPVRGFGMVWRGLGWVSGVQDRLGWATGPEFGFSTAHQCNSAQKYTTCYLQGPDGVIVLEPERSAWHLYTGP